MREAEGHCRISNADHEQWTTEEQEKSTISLTNFCPSSSFVPRNRTTTGTFISRSRNAMMMPSAIISHLVSPPNILTKMVLTRESEQRIRNDALTVSDVAFPPVSRKLAGFPPFRMRASTVFMARPAPLTVDDKSADQTFRQIAHLGYENGSPRVPTLPSPDSLRKESPVSSWLRR